MSVIAFATGNAGKVALARAHLARLGVEVEHVPVDLDEIQSASVQAVARHKAEQAWRQLGRPVIVEDSGFYIDELNFPGALSKHVVQALGAGGIVHLADLTTDRRCHFESVLVYRADDSDSRAYVDLSATGTIARRPADEPHPDAWSPLWDVYIPTGCDRPMSALTAEELARVRAAWRPFSVFTQLGGALADGG